MDSLIGGLPDSSEVLSEAPISLHPWQQLAAFWAIYWPATVAGTILGAYAFAFHFSGEHAYFDHRFAYALYDSLAVFILEAVVMHRLVRKNFRSFHLEVVRRSGERRRAFSMREAILVWWRFVSPQVFVWGAVWLLALFAAEMFSRPGVNLWLRPESNLSMVLFSPFMLGRAAVTEAMRRPYPGFRLEAYRGPR